MLPLSIKMLSDIDKLNNSIIFGSVFGWFISWFLGQFLGQPFDNFWMLLTMDYRRPMKPFFIEIQNFWAWADNSVAFVVFLAELSAPIFVR